MNIPTNQTTKHNNWMKSVEVEDNLIPENKTSEVFYNQVWFNVLAFFLTIILLTFSLGFIITILVTTSHLASYCGASLTLLPLFIFIISAISLTILSVFFGSRSVCRGEKKKKIEKLFTPKRVDQALVAECFKQSCLFFFITLAILTFVTMTIYFLFWSTIFFNSTTFRKGSISLVGIQDTVYVKRDYYGIPHIEALYEQDMWFSQGFVMAQDRLWQLELQRRLAQGRLSEVFGQDSLTLDKMSRTLNFMQLANTSYWNMKPTSRTVIQSFVKGINEYLASSQRSLPIEYSLFFFKPEPFTEIDIVANAKMIAWQMGENHRDEYERYQLLQKGMNLSTVLSFKPDATNIGPTILNTIEANMTGMSQQQIDQNQAMFSDNTGAFIPAKMNVTFDSLIPKDFSDILKFKPQASNSWVISGQLTTTTLPFLANDPHLGFSSPSPLIMMHLHFGTQEIIGASFIGLPGIVSGRTDNFTWGITSNPGDSCDYFVLDDIDKNSYNYKGVQNTFITRTEIIKVKRQPDVIYTVKESVYGPIMNDALNIAGPNSLAMNWTGQQAIDGSTEAFIDLWKSQDFFNFKNYFTNFIGPSFNVLYADKDDNIGYFTAGKIPIRQQGHSGQVPVDGKGNYDYKGYVGTSNLPFVLNPPKGYLVTANNRVTPLGYPISMNVEYPNPYRAKRITDLIQSFISRSQKMALNDMITIQNDVKSEIYTRLRPILLQMPILGTNYEIYRQNLINWDGNEIVNGINTEATLFEAWLMDLGRIVGPLKKYSRNPEYILQVVNGNIQQNCTNLDIPNVLNCLNYAQRKLEISIDNLRSKYGNIPRWGQDIHKSIFKNQILTNTPLQCIVDNSIYTPGGTDTVFENVPFGNDSSVFSLDSTFGPVYKQIIDLNTTENSLFIGTPGQTNNFLGYNYHDLISIWASGALNPSASGYLPMLTQIYNLNSMKNTIKDILYLNPSN